MSIKKNDIFKIEIKSMTTEGSGVGRIGEMAVFVPNSAIGDILDIKILKVKKNYAFGKIIDILTPSKDRIEADCANYMQCGGCTFRHISYEAELKLKQQRVLDSLQRIGGFKDIVIDEIVAAEHPDRYRNKAQIPVSRDLDGKLTLGFFAYHSHRIIDFSGCFLQPKIFENVINAFKDWEKEAKQKIYDESTNSPGIRHLYIRMGKATGEVMVCIVTTGEQIKKEDSLVKMLKDCVPNLKSVVINTNNKNTNVILGDKCRTIWGDGYITDELCGLKFKISPISFYQVNHEQTEKLYTLVANYAKPTKKDVVLDLYCGIGTIGLTLAKYVKELIGVEVEEQAVLNARENALINGINNAQFICADAAKAAKMLSERGERPSIVILDPPRKGCDLELIKTVKNISPEKVVYVSCDPATLARDLKEFCSIGYEIKKVTPVDMFPRTANVETIVLMSRVDK
ncbi:MAG: 23S rRNA (uracil(1939)-C(5))-methyltransferase RlmD [Eubacteriales bacterium]